MVLVLLGFLVWLFATGKFADWAALAKAPAQVQPSSGSGSGSNAPVANSNGQTLPSYPDYNAPAASGDWLQSGWNTLMNYWGMSN